jgi:hypothetical protein
MDLREIGWEDVACIHLAQDRNQWWATVNAVMNLLVPLKEETNSFPRRNLLHGIDRSFLWLFDVLISVRIVSAVLPLHFKIFIDKEI